MKKLLYFNISIYLCNENLNHGIMRIISHRKLKEFYETPGREDSKVALERWYQIAEEAEWRNFSDIRTD